MGGSRPKVDPEAIRSWLDDHPGATAAELRATFPALPESTAQRYVTQGVPHSYERAGTVPVDRLSDEDRDLLVRTVRALGRRLERYSADLESAGGPLDRDEAQAALAVAKTRRELIDAHPGLLEVVKASEAAATDDDDIDDIVSALAGPARA